jgi:hypothetical protein
LFSYYFSQYKKSNHLEYIAQLVEHWTFNPQVLGSSPSVLKKNYD